VDQETTAVQPPPLSPPSSDTEHSKENASAAAVPLPLSPPSSDTEHSKENAAAVSSDDVRDDVKDELLEMTPRSAATAEDLLVVKYSKRRQREMLIPYPELSCEMVEDDKTVGHIMAHGSVVCGLHADGATEPLVDFAISARKPFAVVPCCVFWRTNLKLRQLGVRSYDQFVEHLRSKEVPFGRVQCSTLPFDGRNTVVWWDADETVQPTPPQIALCVPCSISSPLPPLVNQ